MEAERTDLMLAFGDAFNRRDIDSVMSMMTDDCVFVDADGSKHVGPEQVRARFISNWDRKARFHFGNVRHFVSGDRGFLGWTLTWETLGGERCEAEGCDILTFRDGKIAVKDGYLKGTP